MAHVLLIDDDLDQLELRRMVLEEAGCQVRTAADADSAREVFAAASPTHVVMDLRLPRLEDGLALIREFRQGSGDVRIFVLSGLTADFRRRPEARMVDEVFNKPVRTSLLLQRLTVACCALVAVSIVCL